MDTNQHRTALMAAAVYLPLTLLAAGLFALVATQQGRVGSTVVVGGALWVGLLTLIVLMPLVIPAVRDRTTMGHHDSTDGAPPAS